MDEQKNCPLCKKPLTDDTDSYVVMSIYYHSTCLGDVLSKLGSGEYSLVNSVWLLEQRLHTISLESELLAEQMNKKQEEYNWLKDQLAQAKAKEREKKHPSTPVDFNSAL